MDERLKPLLQTLDLNNRLFVNCFEMVDDLAARRRVDRRTNNMSFIGAHLVEARYFLLRQLGQEIQGPFHDLLGQIRRIEELAEMPTVDQILAGWRDSAKLLEARFSLLESEQLEAAFGDKFPSQDPSTLGCISFLLHHEAYHIGQLALLRKSAGLPAMAY